MAEQTNQALNVDFSTAGASAGTILNMSLSVMKNANKLQASELRAYIDLLSASLTCTMDSAVTTVTLSGIGSAFTAGMGAIDLIGGGGAYLSYEKSKSSIHEKYYGSYDPSKPDGNGGIISELEHKYEAARSGGAVRIGADGPVEHVDIEKLERELTNARNSYNEEMGEAKTKVKSRLNDMKAYSTILQSFGQIFNAVSQSVGQVKNQDAQMLATTAQQLAQVLNAVLQASASMSQIDVARSNVAFASK